MIRGPTSPVVALAVATAMMARKAVAVLVPVVVMMATNLHVLVIAMMVAVHCLVMMARRLVSIILGRRDRGSRDADDSRAAAPITFRERRSPC